MAENIEADITINGKRLTGGQSMTVRVAIEHFALWLATEGCGDDEHGKRMNAAYLERIREIRVPLYSTAGKGAE
jgi:hypothetical protein